MSEPCAQRDLVKNPNAMLLWGLPAAIILLTGCCASGWVVTVSWTLSLLVMGIACLVNARGCGRVHCYFLGPFFLLMAGVNLLHGLQVLALGPQGWLYISAALVAGGVSLYFVPEWLWGRYRRVQAGPHEC
ncbi:MAG: hypothetical protein L0099_15750 [Acidobacteria bacterium]|nr:hypothetical protein [Acidobacteriota bacterium]